MRVLVWNVFHGRSLPPSRGGLKAAFLELLAAWEWDVALLQEVPPWWPARLGRELGAEFCAALTSRNSLLPLRRALAERWPELTKSNGGGCNAVLAREQIAGCRARRLRTLPERRVAQLLRLKDGTSLVNYHASARADRAQAELSSLCGQSLAWARDSPLILGGDLNLREPLTPAALVHVAARDVDHLFARGLEIRSPPRLLERAVVLGRTRVELSDHVPILAHLGPASAAADPAAHASR
jgi:endonuclease/exonuclease/phosphatase family metal-dependent hydrolase